MHKAQVKKDAEQRVVQAEAMGAEDTIGMPTTHRPRSSRQSLLIGWCCISQVLLLQEDFVNEKPLYNITSKAEGMCVCFC